MLKTTVLTTYQGMRYAIIAQTVLLCFGFYSCPLKAQDVASVKPPRIEMGKASGLGTQGFIKPQLEPIRLNGVLNFRPEDIDAGNAIAATVTGQYQGFIGADTMRTDTTQSGFLYDIHVTIQSPQTVPDSATALSRLFSSGGTGTVGGCIKYGIFAKENKSGLVAGGVFDIEWTNRLISDSGIVAPSFGFFTSRAFLAAWGGPGFIQADVSYRLVSNDGSVEIKSQLNKAIAVRLTAALAIDTYFLQLRYALPISGTESNRGNFDVRLGYTFDFAI